MKNIKTPPSCWLKRLPDGTVTTEWSSEFTPSTFSASIPVLVNDPELAASAPEAATFRGRVLGLMEMMELLSPTSRAENVQDALVEIAGDQEIEFGSAALEKAWQYFIARWASWPQELTDTITQLLSATETPWRLLVGFLAKESKFRLSADAADGVRALLHLFPVNTEKLITRNAPNPGLYSSLDIESVIGHLKPSGSCAVNLGGYEYRKGQIQMAESVVNAFNISKHLIVEAGTGVGKSMAYLIPAIYWATQNKCPVIISTNTKNLQTQLFEKDIPMLRKAVNREFKAALIKGRTNYLCIRRLFSILEHREEDLSEENELIAFAKTLAWATCTTSGELEELDRLASSGFPQKLYSTGEECGGRRCRFYSQCLLQKARIKSLNADIIVANHSLVFTESSSAQPIALPKHAHIIFDEAHNLEDAATLQYTVEISQSAIARITRKLFSQRKSKQSGYLIDLAGFLHSNTIELDEEYADEALQGITAARIAIENMGRKSRAFFAKLVYVMDGSKEAVRYKKESLGSKLWLEFFPAIDDLFMAIQKLLDALRDLLSLFKKDGEDDEEPSSLELFQPAAAETIRDIEASFASISGLVKELQFVTSPDDESYVFWIDHDRMPLGRHVHNEPMAILKAAPVDISKLLANDLFETMDSVILCSATLSVNGSFNFISKRIGLSLVDRDRLLTCHAESPFDYKTQCRVFVSDFLPEPGPSNSAQYSSELACFLKELIFRTHGRALALFTSYETLQACCSCLSAPLHAAGIQLLAQGGGLSRARITRTFRDDISSVLLGTDSFWEGVDVIGESLSCLIIARLPFDAPSDPLVSARCDKIKMEGGSPFFDFSLPNAIIKFRQGFGRLIRHREDHGIVVIADRRLFSKSYGAAFRRNIPCEPRQFVSQESLLADVDSFFSLFNKC